LGSWVDPIPFQDVGDGRPTDSMPEVSQSTPDAGVSPPRIFSGHSNRQLLDNLHDPTSPRGAALVGPLLRNQLPVPTKDSVGCDERGDLGKGAPANGLTSHGQSASLIVGQPESPATDLLLQDTILFAEVFDDRILLASDPAGQSGDEDLPWLKDGGHSGIVAREESFGQLPSADRNGLFCPEECSAVDPDTT